MASHTRFWIIAFFYLLAVKLNDAHTPPAKPESPPAKTESPPSKEESPPGKDLPPEEITENAEIKFLDAEKECWIKLFGKIEMPPVINNSICLPPPPQVLAAAKAMAHRVQMKSSGSYQDPQVRADILKAIEVPAGGGPANIDPRVKAEICKNLKAIMYDHSSGDVDPNLDAKIQKFVDFLASGPKTGGGAILDLTKMKQKQMEEVRTHMAIALGGDLPGEGLKHSDDKPDADTGYTRAPPCSTILPVAKCVDSPDLDNDIHDKTVEALYFEAQMLSPGKKFKLQFAKSKNMAAFMSSTVMDKSGALGSFVLMDMISILAESMDKAQQANIMPEMDTISLCEQPSTKGKNKEKCCATDIQTMMNYTQAKIGSDLRSACLSVESGKVGEGVVEYTISKLQKLPAVNIVGCSKLSFSIAVFYCQQLPKTVAYTVSLDGADGSKLNVPVLCHEDTTTWNPKSWIFKSLNCKPAPATKICHFLAADDVAWMPKTESNIAD